MNVYSVNLLRNHFQDTQLSELVVTTRIFAHRVRADLQIALGEMLDGSDAVAHFSGLRYERYNRLDFGALTTESDSNPIIAPAEFEAVDVGENEPVQCLKVGFWLVNEDDARYAILMTPTDREDGVAGERFYVASQNGQRGDAIAARVFRRLEEAVARSRSYRGKVLSLDRPNWYTGKSSGIIVHRVPPVKREDLILPDRTVELLERNVIGFVNRRAALRQRGQAAKKGLLFYGPPGTGKTFTIRYLAGALPGHTTLLITAEQVGLLSEYMALARLLQPSIIVIEDADLIGRDRQAMNNVCEEVVLNKLLNEMDGFKEDAEVIFILTTNRPEALEPALASRPGRIDQAIEFPLPDDDNRRKLLHVYGKSLHLTDDIADAIVARTEGVSPAFIKELMRRTMQFQLERSPAPETPVILADISAALEEILFKGGTLNVALLGGKHQPPRPT